MANFQIKRRLLNPLFLALIIFLSTLSVVFLAGSMQDLSGLARYFTIIFVINIIGIVILLFLVIINLWHYYKEFRAGELGSRLTLRFVTIFAVTALLPLSIVYYFSTQFLSNAVDGWYDVKIERALDDSLLLGRTSLRALEHNLTNRVTDDLYGLDNTINDIEIIRLLDDIREDNRLDELTLFNINRTIIASTNINTKAIVPSSIDEGMLRQARSGETPSRIEPTNDGLRMRLVLPVISNDVSKEWYAQVIYRLPDRFAELGNNIEQASQQYSVLEYLRKPLKYSMLLTLTMITIMSGLTALWAGLVTSRKIIQPLKELAIGTRAVAGGNYDHQLPFAGNDELGILVQSFNNMTKEIQRNQKRLRNSQQELEDQRTYLEVVLKRLSSGILSFDLNHQLKTCNEAAVQLLDCPMDQNITANLDDLSAQFENLAPLFDVIKENLRKEQYEWYAEVSILSKHGRQVLNVQGSRLPYESYLRGGSVIVIDDLTRLIQAQRDAAWGEVARRLAHEIKNPLTPIQLSAERIRNKFLNVVPEQDQAMLDRATRTIVQQVESMKHMVNVFSEYAQPVKIQRQHTDINQLLLDVVELHRLSNADIRFEFNVFDKAIFCHIDPGRIRQVFNNLILNAVEAKNEQDFCIRISNQIVEISEIEYIEITFADNGVGIDNELLSRIFEPYVTTKEKGTGLGLSIVKRIIEEHEGQITVRNNDLHGASITIRLPLN